MGARHVECHTEGHSATCNLWGSKTGQSLSAAPHHRWPSPFDCETLIT